MTYFRDDEGNYVRTVTCGYCWTRGHNRSSCPDRAEKIENDRKENGDDGYYVAQYDREQKAYYPVYIDLYSKRKEKEDG